MSLQNKNIVITGATSGFGVAFAALLSKEGANVFIGGRRADRGEQVAKDTNTTFHTVDVANQESNEAFFKAAEKHFGGPQKLDAILLNAGVEGSGEGSQASALSMENYEYVYGVNVRGVLHGFKYGTPLLGQGGSIVVTSSVGSILPMGANPVYVSSKAAVDSLVRAFAAQFQESEDERIKSLSVVAVNPTMYATDMADRFLGGAGPEVMEGFAKMVNPSLRVGSAEELAGIIGDYLKGKLPYKSGEAFAADADTHFPLMEYFDRMGKAAKSLVEEKKAQEKKTKSSSVIECKDGEIFV